MPTPQPLQRFEFDAAQLVREHPLRWAHAHKRALHERIEAAGPPGAGTVRYARWGLALPPATVTARGGWQVRPGAFAYEAPREEGVVEWHMNFADPDLFVAWNTALLAQDELQVVEHPLLAALRLALRARGHEPHTMDDHRRPTPITITGVPRRAALDVTPDAAAGRPLGLYGNAFARAPLEQVLGALRLIEPPTISHILAMSAPPGGHGLYSFAEIAGITAGAYTGYRAARAESEALAGGAARTVIHTGFWGCGAFGGDRTLMTILQCLAADLAGVDLVYHTLDPAGPATAAEARATYERLRDAQAGLPELLDALARARFAWGRSDGN